MISPNFSLLIKPAGPDCNARCAYCFYAVAAEQFARGPHRLTVYVLRTVTRKMLRLGLPVSQFCWQGGEPTLMGLEWFQQAVNFQMQFGRSGQSVANALQTNGLLIDEAWAAFLVRYKFLVGVSLDGPAALHDVYRGGGTHARVMRAVGALRTAGVEFNILSVVNRANEGRGREVYRWLRDQGFDFLQFIPAVETDEHGRPRDFAPTPEGYGRFMCEVFDAWVEEGGPGKVYVRLFESVLSRLAGAPAGNCIMDKRCDHYLVVEHNGDVFPCDFFVRPDMRIGNIGESDLPELAAAAGATAFAAAKGVWPRECDACRFLSLCHGGCLKDRERAGGTFSSKAYLCPSYQIFYNHTYEWFARTAARVAARIARPSPPQPAAPGGRNAACPCGSGKKLKECRGKVR